MLGLINHPIPLLLSLLILTLGRLASESYMLHDGRPTGRGFIRSGGGCSGQHPLHTHSYNGELICPFCFNFRAIKDLMISFSPGNLCHRSTRPKMRSSQESTDDPSPTTDFQDLNMKCLHDAFYGPCSVI